MSVELESKRRIETLISAANEVTGNSDTDLTSAVNSLIDGFGMGGNGLTYDMGEFVVDSDVKHLRSSTDGVPHALGETPEFILIWTDDFSNLSADNVSPYTTNTYAGYLWLKGLMGLEQRLSNAVSSGYSLFVGCVIHGSVHTVTPFAPTSVAYIMSDIYMPTSEVIGLPVIGSTVWLRAGVTYKYFVSKAWWNVGGGVNA